jgi:chemotaxis protein methyltransferase CheR/type IV pilus assembly protein PilK
MALSVPRELIQLGLDRRMAKIGCGDYESYLAQVTDSNGGASELAELLHSVTCGQTGTFCDLALVNLVAPFLEDRVSRRGNNVFSLDLWSAGCGSGAEAWTLAMLARAMAERHAAGLYFGVMGTDISGFALGKARAGIYTESELSTVPPDYRLFGLTSIDPDHARITEELADRVCFVQSNLVTAEELLGIDMDVIICRNVLPHYCTRSKHRILDCLVDHLKPGGLLVVGQGDMEAWSNAAVCTASTETLEACIRQ